MGGFETWSLDQVEPTLKYHPGVFEVLTLARLYRDWETGVG